MSASSYTVEAEEPSVSGLRFVVILGLLALGGLHLVPVILAAPVVHPLHIPLLSLACAPFPLFLYIGLVERDHPARARVAYVAACLLTPAALLGLALCYACTPAAVLFGLALWCTIVTVCDD